MPPVQTGVNLNEAYEILGIPIGATFAEIKKAYHGKAMQLHPDKNLDNKTVAENAMKKVNAAYELLEFEDKKIPKNPRNPSNEPQPSSSNYFSIKRSLGIGFVCWVLASVMVDQIKNGHSKQSTQAEMDATLAQTLPFGLAVSILDGAIRFATENKNSLLSNQVTKKALDVLLRAHDVSIVAWLSSLMLAVPYVHATHTLYFMPMKRGAWYEVNPNDHAVENLIAFAVYGFWSAGTMQVLRMVNWKTGYKNLQPYLEKFFDYLVQCSRNPNLDKIGKSLLTAYCTTQLIVLGYAWKNVLVRVSEAHYMELGVLLTDLALRLQSNNAFSAYAALEKSYSNVVAVAQKPIVSSLAKAAFSAWGIATVCLLEDYILESLGMKPMFPAQNTLRIGLFFTDIIVRLLNNHTHGVVMAIENVYKDATMNGIGVALSKARVSAGTLITQASQSFMNSVRQQSANSYNAVSSKADSWRRYLWGTPAVDDALSNPTSANNFRV